MPLYDSWSGGLGRARRIQIACGRGIDLNNYRTIHNNNNSKNNNNNILFTSQASRDGTGNIVRMPARRFPVTPPPSLTVLRESTRISLFEITNMIITIII